jgi:hypothetical protein
MDATEVCARNAHARIEFIAFEVNLSHGNTSEDLLIESRKRLPVPGDEIRVSIGRRKAHVAAPSD